MQRTPVTSFLQDYLRNLFLDTGICGLNLRIFSINKKETKWAQSILDDYTLLFRAAVTQRDSENLSLAWFISMQTTYFQLHLGYIKLWLKQRYEDSY